jgi:hypothetical protein
MPPEQMTEDELLDRARTAMLKAAGLPPGSLGRSIQWTVHDTAMAELRRRALRIITAISQGGKP